MDCFAPTFQVFFLSEHKKSENVNFFNFLLGFSLFPSSRVFLSSMTIGVKHLVIDGLLVSCKMQNKIL